MIQEEIKLFRGVDDIGALLNIRTVEGCEAVRDQTVFQVGTKSSGCD